MNYKKSYLLKFLLVYKKQVIFLSFLNLLASAFFMAAPYFSKLFIDKAFIGRDMAKFLSLSVIGGALFIFSALSKAVEDILKNRVSIKLKLDLADKFIRKFYSLDLGFFRAKSVGENAYRLADTESAANFILEECPNILADIVKIFVILGVSLWINSKMTALLLVLSPLFLLHRLFLQKKLKPFYEESWNLSAKIYKEIHEAFSRILIIKAFGLESLKRHDYVRSVIRNIRAGLRIFRWSIASSITSSFLSKAVYGAITLYGGWLIIKGDLSIGSYAAVMIYLSQLGILLDSFGYKFEYLTKELVSIERYFEVMNTRPKIVDAPAARSIARLKGEIFFKDVSFGYEEGKEVLHKVNLEIPACSWVGISGPSGCGKTTLISLIMRLYDPWGGEIFLDGNALRQVELKSIRKHISIAAQEPHLFDFTIRENIAFGLKGVTDEQVKKAAQIACIHDFIEQLPRGYSTCIGEDGCRLSEGQKQRLAIARTVLRNPGILILDEVLLQLIFPQKSRF